MEGGEGWGVVTSPPLSPFALKPRGKIMKEVKLPPEGQEPDQRFLAQVKKRFEWALTFLIVRYGFVHQVLSMMTKAPSLKIDTMGVCVLSGARFELRYNPYFVDALTDEELIYVFYHEVMHVVLHHCTSRKFPNHEAGNIAHDLAANEIIPENAGSCERPKDKSGEVGTFVSILQKHFPDIKEKQTCEWYYSFLRDKSKENGGKGDENDKGRELDDHGGWKEDEIASERIRAKVKEIERNNLWGDLSETEKELIKAAQVRRINWRNLIRRFLGNHVWSSREATRKRPNRRMGYIYAGSKRLFVDKALVAVDTSGSVPNELLQMFLGVINGMLDFIPIDLMQFDADKTEGPITFDRRKVNYTFKGRGGTNFEPIMQAVKEKRYKTVVILTDGCAPAPSKPHADVVWVLPPGCTPPVDWGKRIHMDAFA